MGRIVCNRAGRTSIAGIPGIWLSRGSFKSYDESADMGLQGEDISWQSLRRIVHDWAGQAAELAEVKPLAGGSVNTTLLLQTKQGDKAVLKVSPHRVNRELERESQQLELLRGIGLPVPKVYADRVASLDSPDSYLLMEFIEGHDLGTARHLCGADVYDDLQRHLAELVLAMHIRTGEAYGRHCSFDTARFDRWPAFFRHVYDPSWADVEKTALLPSKVKRQIGKIHEKLDRLLDHDDRPRLVHWDIWATNVLVGPDGDGRWRVRAIIDPNCKYAHYEAELAYMELFHTITPAFLKAYQKQIRLGEGYHRTRKWVYQLYPMIHHVSLFGHDYVKPMMGCLERAAHL